MSENTPQKQYGEYRIGQIYDPARTVWPEQGEYNFRDGCHELRLFYRNVRAFDVANIKGTSKFALVESGPVLFLLFKLGGAPWSDAPFSWHLVKEALPEQAGHPPALGAQDHILLPLILVEATNGILKAMSYKALTPEFSRELHAAIERQIAAPFPGRAAYDLYLADVYSRYPSPEEMVPRSKVLCTCMSEISLNDREFTGYTNAPIYEEE